MSDIVVCEKCGGEMKYFHRGSSCGWECHNCGWSVATTYHDEIELDEQLYCVCIQKVDGEVSKEQLKLVSELCQCNFVEAKKHLQTGVELADNKAVVVQNILKRLVAVNLKFSISPEFPH